MKTTTTAIAKNGAAEGIFTPSAAPSLASASAASSSPYVPSVTLLQANHLAALVTSFALAGDIARHCERTLATKRERLGRIVWFAQREGRQTVGIAETRSFFAYLNHGHKQPGGRWENPRTTKPMTSSWGFRGRTVLRKVFTADSETSS